MAVAQLRLRSTRDGLDNCRRLGLLSPVEVGQPTAFDELLFRVVLNGPIATAHIGRALGAGAPGGTPEAEPKQNGLWTTRHIIRKRPVDAIVATHATAELGLYNIAGEVRKPPAGT